MTKRRERRDPEPGEFEDPLKNYEPPEYGDDLERSLCEDTVEVVGHRPFLTVRAGATVAEALRLMADNGIACVVVIDEQHKPVGILSEQDVVNRIAPEYPRIADQPISTVMTAEPVVVYETETPARALNVMGSGFFRHLPVCDVNGKLIGVIGVRRLTEYLQQHVGERFEG